MIRPFSITLSTLTNRVWQNLIDRGNDGTARERIQLPRSGMVTDPVPLTLIEERQGDCNTRMLRVVGVVDHKSYLDLLDHATTLYQMGIRKLIFDLADCEDIGLSGLFAIHSIIMLYRGETPAEPETGLRGLRVMTERNRAVGVWKHIRCINAPPELEGMLMLVV